MPEDLLTDIADLSQYIGLDELERAAAKTLFHMSVCHDSIWDCPLCMEELKTIRKVIFAVRPEIEAAVRREIKAEVPADV